jgi:hypothetical protein
MLEKLLAKRHINRLDLSPVRRKMIEKLGWDSGKTEDVEPEYKRFLDALAHKDTQEVISPPTEEVGEFWHQHILDTRKYRADCERGFGRCMDHTPGLASEQQAEADARHKRVYQDYDIDSMYFGSGDDGGNFSEASGSSSYIYATHDTGGAHHGHGCDSSGHSGDAHGGGDGSGSDGSCSDGGGGAGDGGSSCGGSGGCASGSCGGS